MTQEELDALMSGEIDDLDGLEDEEVTDEQSADETDSEEVEEDDIVHDILEEKLPYPATDENKMVHQLDDVTKESEEKASEIFDIIEGISSDLMEKEESLERILETINSNIELFQTLSAKFPDVAVFQTQLEKNEAAVHDVNETVEALQNSGDSIMNIMDIMQYQDIHRQKIERVINVMRALSKYMNTLFEGKIDDDKRVTSAKHIVGDSTEDLASTDDIEALLAQFSGQ